MLSIRPNTGAPEELLRADETDPGMTVALYRDAERPDLNIIVTRWQPSAADRARVAAGEDIYVIQLSDNATVQPVRAFVGPDILASGSVPDATGEDSPTVPTTSEGAEC